ncbi:hypothetical protein ACS8E3_02010 [Psychrobacter sp. 2Y5]|uniref:hypothetical protein n=1 Tax=unclassified Psychrobacter TaxID=196806 RepID=UPI003F4789C7
MSYYNLEQTLKEFQNKLPEKLLPFDLPQLADLCRRKEITPVFSYDRYINEGLAHKRELPTYLKELTKPFNGYLTLPALTNLLFQLTETVSTSTAYVYEEIGVENKGAFVSLENYGYDRFEDYHDGYNSYSRGDINHIGINNLLFPTEQVQAYISSKSIEKLDDSTLGAFGNPTVAHGEDKTYEQLVEALTAANKKIKQQEQDIDMLNDQLNEQADTSDILNDRNEKSYQTTIGLLLELMTVPKIEGDRPPFTSEAVIIGKIADKSIYGQGKTTLETRFRDVKTTLEQVKKRAFKP